jgi:sugar/nucleoside kinase (ribokinase family)
MIPKLHRANTVACGLLKCGIWVDTVCCHCDNPVGRLIRTSWRRIGVRTASYQTDEPPSIILYTWVINLQKLYP